MRTYLYEGGPNPETGKVIKVIEDESLAPGSVTVKVSYSDFEEAREFWTLMFLTTPASVIAVKGHPRRAMHIHASTIDYEQIVEHLKDPNLL